MFWGMQKHNIPQFMRWNKNSSKMEFSSNKPLHKKIKIKHLNSHLDDMKRKDKVNSKIAETNNMALE